MTGIIVDSKATFVNWCRERKIFRYNKTTFKDYEGEEYVPIIDIEDIMGMEFNEIETIKSVYAVDHELLLYAAKCRIKN